MQYILFQVKIRIQILFQVKVLVTFNIWIRILFQKPFQGKIRIQFREMIWISFQVNIQIQVPDPDSLSYHDPIGSHSRSEPTSRNGSNFQVQIPRICFHRWIRPPPAAAWYLYQRVAQNMLRTHEGHIGFFCFICFCFKRKRDA